MNSKNESLRWKMYKTRGTCPGAGDVPASKEQRVENVQEQRRRSRWDELLQRRNIAETSMSPICSPCISNKKGVENTHMLRSNKRLELLKKWQQEKKKRLEEQKASAKPVFKVHHVSQPAIYDLDTVYKQIKGQPIAASSKNNVQESHRLVSAATYKFKPPANIKPMALLGKEKMLGNKAKSGTNTTRKQKSPSAQQSTSKSNCITRTKSRVKNQEPQPSTSGALPKVKTITNAMKSSAEVSSSPASPTRCERKNDRSRCRRSTRHHVKGEETSSTEESDKEREPPQRNQRKTRQFRQSLSKTTSSSLCTKTDNPGETANGTTESSDSDRVLTPSNKNIPTNVVYVSPFVTMSRGKDNARKEYHRRSTPGGSGDKAKPSPFAKHDESKSTSPKAAATYFYKLLMDQTARLQSLCEIWNYYKEEHNSQEEVCDMINVAIGQTDLLIQKKFKQFKGLIQCCESEDSERRVTCLDLHGFWDTMMIQINNLDQRFDNLERLKQNNWEEILPLPQPKKKGRPKKQASKKPATSSSGLKALIEAARRKKAAGDHNSHLLAVPSLSNGSTPVKTPSRLTRSSLRVSVLTSETRRKISSPGLVMTKVTQIAKSAEKSVYLTPSEAPRSILKAERSKSVRRKSKVVLFKDTDSSDEDKENKNSSNLIDFSEDSVNKTPVRRSSRKKN